MTNTTISLTVTFNPSKRIHLHDVDTGDVSNEDQHIDLPELHIDDVKEYICKTFQEIGEFELYPYDFDIPDTIGIMDRDEYSKLTMEHIVHVDEYSNTVCLIDSTHNTGGWNNKVVPQYTFIYVGDVYMLLDVIHMLNIPLPDLMSSDDYSVIGSGDVLSYFQNDIKGEYV